QLRFSGPGSGFFGQFFCMTRPLFGLLEFQFRLPIYCFGSLRGCAGSFGPFGGHAEFFPGFGCKMLSEGCFHATSPFDDHLTSIGEENGHERTLARTIYTFKLIMMGRRGAIKSGRRVRTPVLLDRKGT